MATITGSTKLNTAWAQTSANLPGTQVQLGVQQNPQFTVSTSGTAADQADLKYTKTLTFVASTPQALDLTSLTDVYGGTVNFKRVKSISIKFKDTTDGHTLLLGYATTTANAWTSLISNPGQITLQASTASNDAFFAVTAPNTTGWVVGSTNKLFNMDPGSNAFSVDIEIVGASA